MPNFVLFALESVKVTDKVSFKILVSLSLACFLQGIKYCFPMNNLIVDVLHERFNAFLHVKQVTNGFKTSFLGAWDVWLSACDIPDCRDTIRVTNPLRIC